MKNQYQENLVDALKNLLISGTAGTQEEILQNLLSAGFQANQSKVSRLLRKLGAQKVTDLHGNTVYSLPKEAAPTASTTCKDLVRSVLHNMSMVVVHTAPGAASLVARLLDHHAHGLNILGVVAGDDAIFIAPVVSAETEAVCAAVKAFLYQH